MPRLDERRYSRALARGLQILECFTPQRPVLGVRELAQVLGMSPATAYRSVRTLVGQGYLEQDAARRYRLTLGATELGMASINETGLCRHARPYLEDLAKRSGFTVALGVLDGPEVLLVAQAPGTRRGQREQAAENVRAGVRLPAHCTSLGKALLAGLPAKRRSSLISEMELERHGPKTIASEDLLVAALARVSEEGLACEDEEWVTGTCAIAAPVRDESGDVIAAASVVARGGAIELYELVDRCGGRLLATAARISARLGWRRGE